MWRSPRPSPAPRNANDAKEQEATMIVPPSHHSAQALANRPTTCAFSASLCRILFPHRAEPASRKTEGRPQSSHAKPHRAQFDSGCNMQIHTSPGSASNTVLARNVPDRHQKRRDNRAFSHKPRRHVPSDSCDLGKQNDGRRDRRETPAPSVAIWRISRQKTPHRCQTGPIGDPASPTQRGLRQLPRGTPQSPCGEGRHPLAQHLENARKAASPDDLSPTPLPRRVKHAYTAKRPAARDAPRPASPAARTPTLTPSYPNPSHTVNFGT